MQRHRFFNAGLFADSIKQLQLSEGITGNQLCKEARITPATLSRLYREHRCGLDTFLALCKWSNLDANGYIK